MKQPYKLSKHALMNLMVIGAVSMMTQSAYAALQVAEDAGSLQRQLQDQVEKSRPEAKEEKIEKQVERVDVDPEAQKIEIKGYQFKGNSLISEAELQEIVAPWNNRALTIAELKEVTVAVQEAYSKKSRIAQANIPPQEIQNGLLIVEVIEGKFGDVHAASVDPNKDVRFSKESAEKFVTQINKTGKFIDANKVYRSITTLNELPGIRASGAYEPGKELGVSDIKLSLKNGPMFNGQVAVSNYGSKSTGEAQAIGNFNLNNPFGIGDIVRLDAIQSEGSTYLQGSYTLPLAFNSLKFGVHASYLSYKTLSDWSVNRAEGDATTFGFNATYALTRTPGKHTSLRVMYENRDYSNDVSGDNVSKYDVSALNLGINGNLADTESSMVNWGVNAVFGDLHISNADQLALDATSIKTHGSFEKLSFNLSRTKELSVWEDTNWIVSVYGQLASKNLNSSEQFYLGGPYGVRAYPVSQGGGDQGLVASTELQHQLNNNWSAGVFADVGVVQQHKNLYTGWQQKTNADNEYALATIGVTAKYTYKQLSVAGMAGYRLGDNPLHTYKGEQLNADNEYNSLQLWIRGSFDF